MSYIDAIVNTHREFEQTITSSSGTGSTEMYITIPCPTWSKIADLYLETVTGSAYTGNITASIYSDGALVKSLGYDNNGITSAAQYARYAYFNYNNKYYEDSYYADYLYLRLTGSIVFPSTLNFNVKLHGFKQTPFNSQYTNNVFKEGFYPSMKVYYYNGSTYSDITQAMRTNAPASQFGDQTYTGMSTTSDILYIGLSEPFSKIAFGLKDANRLGTGNTIIPEFYNGTTWAAIPTVYDNTSVGVTSSRFNYSGTMSLLGMATSGWTKTYLTNEPEYLALLAIQTGYGPRLFLTAQPRFWVRFRAVYLNKPLNLNSVKILS